MLIVGGGKDDAMPQACELQHFEPGEFGHLDVEQHQVGRLFLDATRGFEAVVGLGDDVHIRMRGQKFTHQRARQGFVIGDQGTQLHVCQGKEMLTVKRSASRSTSTKAGVSSLP